MNVLVTGIYVKFSLRFTTAMRLLLSALTLFTRSPPGLSSEGIHFTRAEFTAKVRESFCGVSFGAAGAAVCLAVRFARFVLAAEALEEVVFFFFVFVRLEVFVPLEAFVFLVALADLLFLAFFEDLELFEVFELLVFLLLFEDFVLFAVVVVFFFAEAPEESIGMQTAVTAISAAVM